MQICPVGTKFRADKRTDMAKLVLRQLLTSLSQHMPSFLLGQAMWILWRTKWHWARSYFYYH